MNEQLIIAQLKQGSEQAFKYIYAHYYPLLCRFAYQLLRHKPLAEEVVDDAILYLWEQREMLTDIHSLQAYLLQSVRNRCLNVMRTAGYQSECGRKALSMQEEYDFLTEIFSDDTHPLGMLLLTELQTELKRQIAALPDDTRRVFLLSRIKNKSYEEIATLLGISVNTVKYHIKRALCQLRTNLAPYLTLLAIIY